MTNLNKEHLIEKMVAQEKGLTKAAAGRLIKLWENEIMNCVSEGGRATFPGFGTFVAVDTQERAAANPRTGEKIIIPAGRRIKFKAGKGFKGCL